MLTLKIAFRNVFRQKRRTLLTLLTMLGGFTLAAISIGWSDGTYTHIIDMFTRNRIGHLQIHHEGYMDKPSLYKTIENYGSIGDRVSGVKGVEKWAPRLYSAGLGSIGDKSTGVQIVGIDPVLEVNATGFNRNLSDGRSFSEEPSHETILGKGLAKILEAALGDELVIISQGADGSIANDLYTVIGIVESGDNMSDRTTCYLHLQDAQTLLVLEGQAHEIVVIVSNLDAVSAVTKRLREEFENAELEVTPWQEVAKSFYHAMQMDVQGMWIMIGVIVLIVAVEVLNTVLMSVLERRREYGMLKAMGTRPVQILRLVLYEVAIIALASIIIGVGVSLLANYLLSVYGIDYPEPLTYGGIEFQTLRSEINARSLYIPTLTVLLSALVVSVFPGLKAARTEPAKAMRMH